MALASNNEDMRGFTRRVEDWFNGANGVDERATLGHGFINAAQASKQPIRRRDLEVFLTCHRLLEHDHFLLGASEPGDGAVASTRLCCSIRQSSFFCSCPPQ
jgi:hypothetical protein